MSIIEGRLEITKENMRRYYEEHVHGGPYEDEDEYEDDLVNNDTGFFRREREKVWSLGPVESWDEIDTRWSGCTDPGDPNSVFCEDTLRAMAPYITKDGWVLEVCMDVTDAYHRDCIRPVYISKKTEAELSDQLTLHHIENGVYTCVKGMQNIANAMAQQK